MRDLAKWVTKGWEYTYRTEYSEAARRYEIAVYDSAGNYEGVIFLPVDAYKSIKKEKAAK